MGPQLRYACIICFICYSCESQPPSPSLRSGASPAPGRKVHRAALPQGRTLGTRNLYATHIKKALLHELCSATFPIATIFTIIMMHSLFFSCIDMLEFQSGFWWNLLVTGNFNGSTITLRLHHLFHLSFFRESAPFTLAALGSFPRSRTQGAQSGSAAEPDTRNSELICDPYKKGAAS